MSRIQGDLITIAGCIVSLLCFYFFPYEMIPSQTRTGAQLGDPISLSNSYFLVMLQNARIGIILLWGIALLLLIVLVDVVLVGLTRRTGRWRGWGIATIAGLTLFLALSNLTSDLASGFSFGTTENFTLFVSLLTPGFLGLLAGLIVAFIGSVITLRSRRRKSEKPVEYR